jgi:hypothetical protein
MLELRKLNWRHYIRSNNPVSAALLSKMGYTETERVQVKKEFMRMLVRMELNPAKLELINGFFETYLSLNESEKKELMREIKQLPQNEAEPILKLPNSWKEKGIREEREKITRTMLKEGLSIEIIARVTGLRQEEIEKLKQSL